MTNRSGLTFIQKGESTKGIIGEGEGSEDLPLPLTVKIEWRGLRPATR